MRIPLKNLNNKELIENSMKLQILTTIYNLIN